MTDDIMVIMGATERAHLMNEYVAQLGAARIPVHVEPWPMLQHGPNSVTMAFRMDFWRNMSYQYKHYRHLIFTDAWDVLFFGDGDRLRASCADVSFMISGERGCYPEYHLADKIPGPTPWRYCNAGLMIAQPGWLLMWLEQAERLGEMHLLDQAWFNRRTAQQPAFVPRDVTTSLFYVVSATQEDGSLQMKGDRLWNAMCDTYPQFFHFSGKCSPESVRNLMREKV